MKMTKYYQLNNFIANSCTKICIKNNTPIKNIMKAKHKIFVYVFILFFCI